MVERRVGVARVLLDSEVVPGDPVIDDGRIVAVEAPLPGASGLAVPGLVDLQVNGITDPGVGSIDFSDAGPGEMRSAARALAEHGVTAFCPTLITAPPDHTIAALQRLEEARIEQGSEPARNEARILGAHLEGPFLSAERLGAHPAAHRRDPELILLGRLLAAGPVQMVTLAPELAGAVELIQTLRNHDIVVAAGHSDATAAEAAAGFAAGVTLTTHHGNAMRPFTPRAPGLFGRALVEPDVGVPIIADGHHLAAETTKLIAAAVGERLILVSDAVAHGRTLGGATPLRSVDGAVRDEAGRLAGSALWLDDAVRNLVDLGLPRSTTLAAASTTPARYLRRPEHAVRPGAVADIVVFDESLSVREVFVAGQRAHRTR